MCLSGSVLPPSWLPWVHKIPRTVSAFGRTPRRYLFCAAFAFWARIRTGFAHTQAGARACRISRIAPLPPVIHYTH